MEFSLYVGLAADNEYAKIKKKTEFILIPNEECLGGTSESQLAKFDIKAHVRHFKINKKLGPIGTDNFGKILFYKINLLYNPYLDLRKGQNW